jgi:fucose 4-O-acetylase-like acetyltransferase
MPLFFFLSGLFFYSSLKKRGAKALVINKVDTLFYPYIIWSLLQGGIEFFLSSYLNGSLTVTEVLSIWNPRAQFWFLIALFLIFSIVTIIFNFFSINKIHYIFVITTLIYLLAPYIDTPILRNIAQNIVFFTFGIYFTRYNLNRYLSSVISCLIFCTLFVLIQYLFHGKFNKLYTENSIFSLVVAFISILFLVCVSNAISKKGNKLLAFIGTSSMAIYLMHILAGSGTRVILIKLIGINSVEINLFVGCIAGIFLPIIALYIINTFKIKYLFSAPISQIFKINSRL